MPLELITVTGVVNKREIQIWSLFLASENSSLVRQYQAMDAGAFLNIFVECMRLNDKVQVTVEKKTYSKVRLHKFLEVKVVSS